MGRLTEAQQTALRHVQNVVRHQEAIAQSRVADHLQRAGCTSDAYAEAMECVRAHARVVIHFHPDRLSVQGRTVAEGLLAEGLYRSQFETGLSAGSTTAYPGGERDDWEKNLFGGAYHSDGVTGSERPKYGSLELVRYPDGPMPRFGSCYVVLRPEVSTRTSFTFMGSEHPRAGERLGTIDHMHAVMAALLDEIEQGGIATPPWPPFKTPTLGVPDLTVGRLLDLLKALPQPRRDPSEGDARRVLDTQIEAQVHGPIDLHEDVELLVADRAFALTPTGTALEDASRKYEIPIQRHRGFRLPVREVPDDFRGPPMPKLAQRIAGSDGVLDAAIIGAAEASLKRDPGSWSDWGSRAEALQHLKQLWHVLVHFGRPANHL